jgi:hypothetical protein
MSKYNDDVTVAWASVLIANELAEANRLKRIEITKYCNVNRHGISHEELEDQA